MTSPRALWGNEFQSSSYGLRCTASNSIGNSLFLGNYDGLLAYDPVAGGELAGELTLTNCTFSDNENGVHAGGVEGTQNKITVKDCVFTHSPTSWSPTFAIRVHGDDCGLDESHNGFFKPGAGTSDHVWFNTGWVPINPQNSLNLSQKPYDTSADYARRFLLTQPPAPSPPVNAGSRSSEAAALNVETTSVTGGLDTDIVDMGYHYRVLPPTSAPGPDNVLVVYNANASFPESLEIADYYRTKRGIPQDNMLGIDVPVGVAFDEPSWDTTEKKNITQANYYDYIIKHDQPGGVAAWFQQHPSSQIRFVALCKGLPYRIWVGNGQMSITARLPVWEHDTKQSPASFGWADYRESSDVSFRGAAAKRRFGRNVYSVSSADETRRAPISCLATMLIGYNYLPTNPPAPPAPSPAADVKKMIDRSVGSRVPRNSVYWVFDWVGPSPPDSTPHVWQIAPLLEVGVAQSRIKADSTYNIVLSADISDGPLMGYSMYPVQFYRDPYSDWRRTDIDFRPANGAIELAYESHNGRGFMEGTPTWTEGLLADGFHAGANQASPEHPYSRCFSGGLCSTQEPGLGPNLGDPQVMFPRYFQGYTFAEAAFMASGLGGPTLHVGDPLMTLE